jgi:hypothetical protein
MNLVEATPTEQVIPCSSAIVSRIRWAIWRGVPNRRRAPDTSRNASSRDSGSTIGVTLANTAMTAWEMRS